MAVPVASFNTAEVRWFASGPLPGSYVDWFSNSGQEAFVEVRSDRYWTDGRHSTGLKRRGDGPFEVKHRSGLTGFVDLGSGIRAQIEEWQKISPVEPQSIISGRSGEWVEVHKIVLTRSYALLPTGDVDLLRNRDLGAPGCDVELASVHVADGEAWSFALEAWGLSGERQDILDGALASFVRSSPIPIDFLACLGRGMGYPEWLAGTSSQGSVPK